MAPHRDPGPNAGDGPVVWCQERAKTKTGVSLFVGAIGGYPDLDPWPLSKFKTKKPTALDLANLVELKGEGGPQVDVFKRASDANPADEDDIVDLNKYGLTMDDPILLVNHHPDAQKIYQMTQALKDGGASDKEDGNSDSEAGKNKKNRKDRKKPKKTKKRRASSSSSSSSSSASSSSSSGSDLAVCDTNRYFDEDGAPVCASR
ncbi:hypothetical protein MSAN_00295900 [Mycena sanguinolenta]|uniref:Uncharacterized protein n=1 Tax=Mycena sanguinolenta TaxID=230812 RepID=A0A8H6Z7U7_9AGAR|nr:hypothetical protein MSAN_00295900 [Mycena sanguinolenta]